MSKALALAATLTFARVAVAQPGATPPAPEQPAPAPADPAAPAPVPAPAPADPAPPADPAYSGKPDTTVTGPDAQMPGVRRGNEIVVRYTPDRSRQNITLLSVLGGSAVVFGAIGLYFHFDSRSSSDEVSADRFTGHAWTADRQQTYDDALSSRKIAIATYSIGSALLLATAIVYMVTEPKQVETVITPRPATRATAIVAPTRGGALVGGTWSF